MELLKLKEELIAVDLNALQYSKLLPKLIQYIQDYYNTIHQIHSKYDIMYIPYDFERDLFFGLYKPEQTQFKIIDYNEEIIQFSYRYYTQNGSDLIEEKLPWDKLINFISIQYEWELCKGVREIIFNNLTAAQLKVEKLFKMVSENDVEYTKLKTLIENKS